jgi:hypothetical protein
MNNAKSQLLPACMGLSIMFKTGLLIEFLLILEEKKQIFGIIPIVIFSIAIVLYHPF